jgi:CDGSH-type Zn-finger protein
VLQAPGSGGYGPPAAREPDRLSEDLADGYVTPSAVRRPARLSRGENVMSETLPLIAQKGPYMIAVEAGKSYWWCACGRSKGQPFCDGSHKGSGFSPIEYKSETAEDVWFCGCKRSGGKPCCDGTHETV